MDKKTILIVDDEKDVLLVLTKRLEAEGFSVIAAANGRDAVTLARTQSPDLIILDVVMPDMGGGEVAEKLKENIRTKSIPVIFLTALLTRNEEYKKNHIIADNVTFAKPIDTAELLAQIKVLLPVKEMAIGK